MHLMFFAAPVFNQPLENWDTSKVTRMTFMFARTARFDQSLSARRVFGDDFVDHFVLSRRHEASEYERSINDWQLERYFEII